ncbi:MAG: hypothetical protein QM756_29425 [Polyangiaceae bacterium]
MGWFGKWFGAGQEKFETPDALRTALFDAALQGDKARLRRLCAQHGAAVFEHFPSWQKVPLELRQDPTAMQRYANGLIGVANHFDEHGQPQLLERLAPPDNPIERAQETLGEARALLDQCEYTKAAPLLGALVDEFGTLSGSAVERYLPVAHGFIAELEFHSGKLEQAVASSERALALCEASGDREGVVAYQGNLYELQRYLGNGERAASHAARLQQLFEPENPVKASWFRSQGVLCQRGEPLNRVVAMLGEQCYELPDLPRLRNGKVSLAFQRNRITLRPAERAIEEGKRLGSLNRYLEALAAFTHAASLDRFSPEPSYLSGLSLLHLRRYADALRSYITCESLAPGWFHARTDLWFAEQLSAGLIEHAALLTHLQLADGPESPSEKFELASRASENPATRAVFEYHRGRALLALGRSSEAASAFRVGLAVPADAGTRTRLLLQLGLQSSGSTASDLMRQAIELDGDRIAAAGARLQLLNSSS